MKRFWASVSLCLLLLAARPVHALPRVVEGVLKNREFFAAFTAFEEYENCHLYDVTQLSKGPIGLTVLSPLGFEVRLVVEVGSGETVYKDIFVPEKGKREEMMRESLRVADAVKLAKAAITFDQRRPFD